MMRCIVPDYYGKFCCLAECCRHNCCIGWEIDVDDDTHAFYQTIGGAFGERLRTGITQEGCFRLDAHERCVFLNEQGLCDIILTLGEEALCDICTDHPRFRRYTDDRVYMGLGLCCEEACRLILGTSDPVRFVDCESGREEAPEAVIRGLQDRRVPLAQRLSCADMRTPAEWAAIYRSLERLDPVWDTYLGALAMCDAYMIPKGYDTVWEQLAVYFVYRHGEAALPFAAHAVRVIQTLCAARSADFDELCEICRLYSAEIEYSDENISLLNKHI